MDAAVVVLVAVAMAAGIAGTVLPIVPGLALVAGASLVYGLSAGFGSVGVVAFGVIVTLGIAGAVGGLWLPHRAAGNAGAPRSSLLLGAVGAIIGCFAIPLVGLPVGGVAGIYLAERRRTQDAQLAWRTTVATLKGFGLGALVQLAAGLLMAGTWVIWVILD